MVSRCPCSVQPGAYHTSVWINKISENKPRKSTGNKAKQPVNSLLLSTLSCSGKNVGLDESKGPQKAWPDAGFRFSSWWHSGFNNNNNNNDDDDDDDNNIYLN